MLSLLLQSVDTLRRAGTVAEGADGGTGAFAFWTGVASVIGLLLTVVGLRLTIKSLREAREAQKAAVRAQEDAEAIRDKYARKQRLPEFQADLQQLATRLDTALNDFEAMQAEAQETTALIVRTLTSLAVHLRDEQLAQVNDLAGQVQRNAGIFNLQNGQHVRRCTREVVLYLDHVIGDDRAKSL